MKANYLKIVDGQFNYEDIEKMVQVLRCNGFSVKWINKDHYITFMRRECDPNIGKYVDDAVHAV